MDNPSGFSSKYWMRHLITIVENALMETRDAPLYHATNFQNAKGILTDGFIRAYGGDERAYVCTTRDKNLMFKDQHVQFVIDTAKVKTRYAIQPIDFHAGFANARRESEERIITTALPLSMVQAVMLMPIRRYPPGIMAVMYREGDEVAALAAQRGIEVIDRREPLPIAENAQEAGDFTTTVETHAHGHWDIFAFVDGVEIGYLTVVDDGDRLRVFSSVIYRQWRGQGYGKRLYLAAMEFGRRHGYRAMVSGAMVSNSAARLWQSLGASPFIDEGNPRWSMPLAENAQTDLTRIWRVKSWTELKRRCDRTAEGKLRCIFLPGEGVIAGDAYMQTHYSIAQASGIDPSTPGSLDFIVVNCEKFHDKTSHYLPFDGPYSILYYGEASEAFARFLGTTSSKLKEIIGQEIARRGDRGPRLSPRMEPPARELINIVENSLRGDYDPPVDNPTEIVEFRGLTFRGQTEDGNPAYYVYKGDMLVGFFTLDEPWSRPGEVIVHPEIVPELQHQGYGTIIYDFAEQYAEERGKVLGQSAVQSPAAQAFWKKRLNK